MTTVLTAVEATDLTTTRTYLISVDRGADGTLLHLDPQGVPDWADLTQADVDRLTGDLDVHNLRWLLARYMAGQFDARMVQLTDGQVADLGDLLRAGGAA